MQYSGYSKSTPKLPYILRMVVCVCAPQLQYVAHFLVCIKSQIASHSSQFLLYLSVFIRSLLLLTSLMFAQRKAYKKLQLDILFMIFLWEVMYILDRLPVNHRANI